MGKFVMAGGAVVAQVYVNLEKFISGEASAEKALDTLEELSAVGHFEEESSYNEYIGAVTAFSFVHKLEDIDLRTHKIFSYGFETAQEAYNALEAQNLLGIGIIAYDRIAHEFYPGIQIDTDLERKRNIASSRKRNASKSR